MPYAAEASAEPTREEVDQMPGTVLLEFGAAHCPHCHAAQPVIQEVVGPRRDVKHIKIEDGRGKPLGRSFRVKLWPNLVLMRDGQVLEQLARPNDEEVRAMFVKHAPGS